ncbi:MAG: heat-shock protein [Candidatus Magasanikbacteria bacterium GW2011_GWA2_37_8]|uniref:Heat-shock protein n=1 Tax=Candidatus Magasanikbacteria bacterium GW2011_GWA2_37_8 TaxID=1619036 RepID=A0A0G0KJ71_9BACT|nr:MAG: heat-shock protein [Candidatus Magasanikbacteria bacterium GW2011_GWA2_37_8]
MPQNINLSNDSFDVAAEELNFLSALATAGASEHESEGQLSIDVAEMAEELIVVATMAGSKPDNIELHLHNDVLTIRGTRTSPIPEGANHFYEECFWGKFSRTIVLPVDVKPEVASAEYKQGVLIVHLAKAKSDNNIPIYVVEE